LTYVIGIYLDKTNALDYYKEFVVAEV